MNGMDDEVIFQVQVTNFDQEIEVREMIKSLLSIFNKYVKVLYLTVSLKSRLLTKAIAGFRSFREAEYAVFEFHGECIGNKIIHVSCFPQEEDTFENLKNAHTLKEFPVFWDFNDVSIPDDDGCFLVYSITEDQKSKGMFKLPPENVTC